MTGRGTHPNKSSVRWILILMTSWTIVFTCSGFQISNSEAESPSAGTLAEIILLCKAETMIPSRQIRRMGSEFLGKRTLPIGRMEWIQQLCQQPQQPEEDEEGELQQQPQSPLFCQCVHHSLASLTGNNNRNNNNMGKRGLGAILLSGKRMTSKYNGLQRRTIGSEFLGKRALGSEFLGKRVLGSEFLGKRVLGSEFLGKRSGAASSSADDQPSSGETV